MDADKLNELSRQIVDAAIKVHRALGPGLLESAYRECLLFELHRQGVEARKELAFPVVYEGVHIDVGYKLDMLVENAIVLELKSVEKIHPIHEAQLLSYLKLGDFRLGLLINFNVMLLKDGIKRMVNKF